MIHLGTYTTLLIIVSADIHSHSNGVGWNPANYSYTPGPDYQVVWQDNFENVGPIRGMINEQPACGPNPKIWILKIGHIKGDFHYLLCYRASIYTSSLLASLERKSVYLIQK